MEGSKARFSNEEQERGRHHQDTKDMADPNSKRNGRNAKSLIYCITWFIIPSLWIYLYMTTSKEYVKVPYEPSYSMTGLEAQAAITIYTSLLDYHISSYDQESIANCSGMLAEAYFYNDDYIKANTAIQNAIQISNLIGYTQNAGFFYITKFMTDLQYIGEVFEEEAYELMQIVLLNISDDNDMKLRHSKIVMLAYALQNVQLYDEAATILENVGLTEVKSDSKLYAIYLLVSGIIRQYSNPDLAITLIKDSVEQAEKINFTACLAYSSYWVAYYQANFQKDYEVAISNFEKVLPIAKNHQMRFLEAHCYSAIAYCYASQGDIAKKVEFYQYEVDIISLIVYADNQSLLQSKAAAQGY